MKETSVEKLNALMARVALAVYGDRKGVTAVEYGLIAGLIAVAIIAAITTLGTNLSTLFSQVAGNV
jgi:pilus assembly protein Flp/PilA